MACADAPYLSSIALWPLSWAPEGWMLCQGQSLAVSQYQALYSLLGNTFGGTTNTTFNLPDMRGRFPLGAGQNQKTGTNYAVAAKNDMEKVTLTVNQMPQHSHPATFTPGSAFNIKVAIPIQNGFSTGGTNPAGNYLGTSDGGNIYYPDAAPGEFLAPPQVTVTGGSGSVTVGNNGGSQPFSIMPSYLALNYMICVSNGIYPVRPQ
ncbi:MAG: tail fiber protein [Ignavibacteria bacterium]|jgi:microcystin-dependent protein|nr:tail fiber protein [Ignavibacteria bacterium]